MMHKVQADDLTVPWVSADRCSVCIRSPYLVFEAFKSLYFTRNAPDELS
jgi:hypothetical protein